jgi:uncharacterized protein YjiS (DUF1127 family)
MIVLTLLRMATSVWTEARAMQAETMRRYPHLREAVGPEPHSHTHRGILPMLMSLVLTKVQRWLTYHKTIRELESLSERELSDLGIGRADIRHIARHATG